MGLITRQPNRQFQDNMVSQLDDNMDRQKHDIGKAKKCPAIHPPKQ